MRSLRILLLLSLSVFNPVCLASLSSVDLLGTGDGYVTRDSTHGLDWLDVSLTTRLSVNDIESGAGGWTTLGFRYASSDDLRDLLSSANLAETTGWNSVLNDVADMITLLDLLGVTYTGTDQYETFGLLSNTQQTGSNISIQYANLGYVGSFTKAKIDAGTINNSAGYDNLIGSFLIRDVVPVPAPTPMLPFVIALSTLRYTMRVEFMRQFMRHTLFSAYNR